MQSSSGVPAVDEVLHGIHPGDTVVWKVDHVEAYAVFVGPFAAAAIDRGQRVVYFRFAPHRPLVRRSEGVQTVVLDPAAGFEQFITEIHSHLAETDQGIAVVFDLLTHLAEFFSERMIGNFFRLTCPRIRASSAVAYHGMVRNYHSFHAASPVFDAADVLIDAYHYRGRTYLHPQKVEQRYSPTMYRLHRWEGDCCVPISDSATTTSVVTSTPWPGLRSASYRMIGVWDRRFIQGETLLQSQQRGEASRSEVDTMFERLSAALLSRDERVMGLVRRYLTLEDLIDTWKHVIGSGMIGGKAVGVLLARAILRHEDPTLNRLLERHDSFFIGSEVFYSFLVENDCWWIRERQKRPETLLDGLGEARGRILRGRFPDYLLQRFSDVVDYFGQSPFVVRSSSLLEDACGNAYAGKYQTVFCPNQGTHTQRLEEFVAAVRTVYASTLSEEALVYRAKCGALDSDEQMALLVQRVSGAHYGEAFCPQLAGVGFSYNPFVWHPDIDPHAGVVRLVFGLGTRAVDRHDDDYTRIVAVNAPALRPENSPNEASDYRQRKVDYINLKHGKVMSDYFADMVSISSKLPVESFGFHNSLQPGSAWELDLEEIIASSGLIEQLGRMMKVLRTAYGCEVDIEFAANAQNGDAFRINLLQCRPLQVRESTESVDLPATTSEFDVLMEMNGPVLGGSRRLELGSLVYVPADAYSGLSTQQRYAVARDIGTVVHAVASETTSHLMLLGPGRWGSQLPELGIPVRFNDIDQVAVLCELEMMHAGLAPDLSLGTHFFHELVELDLLYLGFVPGRAGNLLAEHFLRGLPNQLHRYLPDADTLAPVVHVIEAPEGKRMVVTADQPKQRARLVLEGRV